MLQGDLNEIQLDSWICMTCCMMATSYRKKSATMVNLGKTDFFLFYRTWSIASNPGVGHFYKVKICDLLGKTWISLGENLFHNFLHGIISKPVEIPETIVDLPFCPEKLVVYQIPQATCTRRHHHHHQCPGHNLQYRIHPVTNYEQYFLYFFSIFV